MTDARAWSLMTKSRGGVVSIIRDMTLDECRQTYHRLNPNYGTTFTSYEVEGGGSVSYGGRTMTDGEMEIREVFGPTEWDRSEIMRWDGDWPKHQYIKLNDPQHPKYQGAVAPSMTLDDFDARRAAYRGNSTPPMPR